MANKGKRYSKAVDGIDRDKLYGAAEAVKMVKERAVAKFDETIELAMNLGVDPRHADQMVRGVVALPAGTGRDVRVAVFARDAKAEDPGTGGGTRRLRPARVQGPRQDVPGGTPRRGRNWQLRPSRYRQLQSGVRCVYSDIGYFTTDAAIASDVLDLFNALTGYSQKADYSRLLVSPHNTRSGIIKRIEREVRRHQKDGNGHIGFKLNSLVDKACIKALYRASRPA